MKKYTIATRRSKLAIAQSRLVCSAMFKESEEFEFLEVVTKGDQLLSSPLYDKGGKGLFVKELEQKILDREADFAIHSAKDMPYQMHNKLAMVPVLKRENPKDVLVSNKYKDIKEIPAGAVIGTSSLRRTYQVQQLLKDASFKNIRGNIHTRINKMLSGEYDALILAAAGIARVDDLPSINAIELDTNVCVPAAGQGILFAQYHSDDKDMQAKLSLLTDSATSRCVWAERKVISTLEAGCHTPVAAYAVEEGDKIILTAWVGSKDNNSITVTMTSALEEYLELGSRVAEQLKEDGALKLLGKC